MRAVFYKGRYSLMLNLIFDDSIRKPMTRSHIFSDTQKRNFKKKKFHFIGIVVIVYNNVETEQPRINLHEHFAHGSDDQIFAVGFEPEFGRASNSDAKMMNIVRAAVRSESSARIILYSRIKIGTFIHTCLVKTILCAR